MWKGVIAASSVVALVLVGTSHVAGADLPLPEGAELTSTKSLANGGQKRTFRTAQSSADLVASYGKALEAAGWSLTRQGSGGGQHGSGAEITANRGEEHLVLQAGGPKGRTFIGMCVWPKRPANDYCG